MRLAAWFVFATIVALQVVLAVRQGSGALGGDEPYYTAKARYFVQHHAFQRASPEEMAIEHGAWGSSDWRPQGYPLFVALFSGGSFEDQWFRIRLTLIQAALIALALCFAMSTLLRTLDPRYALIAAVVLGVAPWPWEYVTLIGPDSPNAALTFFALFLLSRRRFFSGSLLMTATFLLRPEMIALAPLMVAAALVINRSLRRETLLASAAAFFMLVSAHYAYRIWFTGERFPGLFGGFHLEDQGAYRWAGSWVGTEHEAYDFVYSLTNGQPTPPVPPRAFSSPGEQSTIERLVDQAHAQGYSEQIDAAFARVAEKRAHEHPLAALVLPRLWHVFHLWVNTETTRQLLVALAAVPRLARHAILGVFVALKLLLLAAFGFAVFRTVPRSPVLAVLASFVLLRTALIGLVMNSMVHRHVITAWIPLIVCALSIFAVRRRPDAATLLP